MFTVDTFIGTGVYQTGSGEVDFPISYIASDNVLGGRMAAVQEELSRLPEEDLQAIAAYLKAVPPLPDAVERSEE